MNININEKIESIEIIKNIPKKKNAAPKYDYFTWHYYFANQTEGDYDVEDFYKNYNNAVIPVENAPFHKRLNPLYSKNKHLPLYHAFSQIQDFPMLIARFVFTKK